MTVFKASKSVRTSIERAWRDRLAHNLKNFRRVKGRWPDKQILSAVKYSIAEAASLGCRPPYQH